MKIAVRILLFVILFAVSFVGLFNFLQRFYTTDKPNHSYFGVVAKIDGKWNYIRLTEIEEFKATRKNCSLLIPKGEESVVEEDLRERFAENNINPTIMVNDVTDGKQVIEIELSGNTKIGRSKYEVTENQVNPISFTLVGPLYPLIVCVPSLLIVVFVAAIDLVMILILRKKAALS